jgi:hypothetical protein
MRENRPYGSEGGESGSTGLPYPYRPSGDKWLRQFMAHLVPLGR